MRSSRAPVSRSEPKISVHSSKGRLLVITHMGGTWGKTQELATIKSGGIWYKKAVVYAVDARIFGSTAILLEDIDLQAAVGDHEVTNPFMVTEVYIQENGKWKLAQLTFSHLLRPVKMNSNKN